MADLFELNINKYSLNELKELMQLDDLFTMEDVVNQEDKLREHLLADNNITLDKKERIVNFLDEAKGKLLMQAKKKFSSHEIIKKTPGNIGHLNPIHRKGDGESHVERSTIKRMISIDSQFRENYYDTKSTDFHYTLPTTVKNVISMELSAMEIPSTFYQISRSLGNDYFWLYWGDPNTTADSWYFISIPEGNYSRSEMVNIINIQIDLALEITTQTKRPIFIIDKASGHSAFAVKKESDTENSCELKIAFNRMRGNYIATHVGAVSNDDLPDIDILAPGGIMGKIGWILGFRLAEYTNDGGYADLKEIVTNNEKNIVSGGYLSKGVYNAWVNRYFYIVVDDFNKNANNFIVPAYAESLGSANILARFLINPAISFNEGGYTIAMSDSWNDTSTKKRSYFGPVDIQKIHFQIIDSFGRVIDLNNMDCSFALNMVCLYDQ